MQAHERYNKMGKRGKTIKTRYEFYGYNVANIGRTGESLGVSANQKFLIELEKYLSKKKINKPSNYTQVLNEGEQIRYMSHQTMGEVIKFIIDSDNDSNQALETLRTMKEDGDDTQAFIISNYLVKNIKKDDDSRTDDSVKPRYVGEFLAYLRYYNRLQNREKDDE